MNYEGTEIEWRTEYEFILMKELNNGLNFNEGMKGLKGLKDWMLKASQRWNMKDLKLIHSDTYNISNRFTGILCAIYICAVYVCYISDAWMMPVIWIDWESYHMTLWPLLGGKQDHMHYLERIHRERPPTDSIRAVSLIILSPVNGIISKYCPVISGPEIDGTHMERELERYAVDACSLISGPQIDRIKQNQTRQRTDIHISFLFICR